MACNYSLLALGSRGRFSDVRKLVKGTVWGSSGCSLLGGTIPACFPPFSPLTVSHCGQFSLSPYRVLPGGPPNPVIFMDSFRVSRSGRRNAAQLPSQ